MELRELQKGDKFRIVGDKRKDVFIFDHLDGMYSYNVREKDGKVAHFKQWAPVEKIEKDV